MSATFDALKAREESLLCRTYGRYPVSVKKGLGSRLWDFDDREYVDLLSGIAVTSLGHCNPELAEVMAAQAHKLWHVSNLFYQEEQLDLAEKLLSTIHCTKAFFCNSGAEANEAAIKLARRYMQRVKNTEAYEIITLGGAFHGRTLATVAATGQARFQDGFAPIPQGFSQVEWGNMDALRAAIGPQTAGVLVEVVQGEGGVRPLGEEYAKAIEALCREKGVLFMVDEVQTGMCRTGRFWAHQHYGLTPDIVTSAKALANGLPMGAMMATEEVAQGFVAGSHATTFGASAMVSAVALRTLEIMERDKLAERAEKIGNRVMDRIRAINNVVPNSIVEVRGFGFMIGIVLSMPAKPMWAELLNRGFICNNAQEYVLRLVPALTTDEADFMAFADTLEDILKGMQA
ncbi:MAG: aspartate aminotransferase family protein [Pseudomonadota bacterium]